MSSHRLLENALPGFNILFSLPFILGLFLLFRPRRRSHPADDYLLMADRWLRGGIGVGLAAAALLTCDPMSLWPSRLATWEGGLALGLCVVAGVVVPLARAPKPTPPRRTARLTPRSAFTYLPRAHVVGLVGLCGVLLLLLTGNAVTQLVEPTTLGVPAWTFLNVAEVMVGGGICLVALRKIAGRPVLSGAQADHHVDESLRATSARAIVYAWGCLTAGCLFTSAATIAILLSVHLGEDAPWWQAPFLIGTLGLALTAAVTLICLIVALTRLPERQGGTA